MPQLTSNKLRRTPAESPTRSSQVPRASSITWRGLGLDELGEALTKLHHEKIVWKKLAESISASMENQAIAFLQNVDGEWNFLSVDGLHEELKKAITQRDPLCPFLTKPEEHVQNLSAVLSAFPDAGPLYEFIDHYWGWRLASEHSSPIYLMIFGTEQDPPSSLANNAAHLASYLCWHISSEKRRKQLTSDLSAETQGLRISAADVLRRRLEQWMSRNDGAR